MKSIIKRIVPKALLPSIRKVYKTVFTPVQTQNKQIDSYKQVGALACTVSYNKYGAYCVPLSSVHRPAARKILSNEVYEAETIEYILSNCGDGDVIHAGTYFGDFLPALSKGLSENASILAFEPNQESYRCARITIELNQISNVSLTNAGLGSKQEELMIKTIDSNGGALGGASQIISDEARFNDTMQPIQIVAVDDIVSPDRQVSIIQLDVEGHEKQALCGSLMTIKRCLPIIILEVLPESNLLMSDWFNSNIIGLGYKKVFDIQGNSIFLCR